MSWPIIIRFALPLPLGAGLGIWVFQGLSPETVKILIGIFVLLSLVSGRRAGFGERIAFMEFLSLGFVAGILNMIVGAIAPILFVCLLSVVT